MAKKGKRRRRASPANTVRGDVRGNAVQAGQIHGDVHFHRSTARTPDGPVVVGHVPQCPSAFRPRSDLVDQYDRLIADGRPIVALTGMRGIGKTQIAASVARARIEEQWPAVAWITASTLADVTGGFAELAVALGLRESADDTGTAADRARRWLQTAGRCLVVFDNALDPDILIPWLPAAGGAHVLITSTQRGFDDLAAVIDVGVFTEEESLSFLAERAGRDDDPDAAEVAEEVGHLPLALAQSAAVVRRQRLTFAEFLRRLRTIPVQDYLGRRPGDPYPYGAAAAILLSIESAERDDPRAGPLIDLLSLLSPAGVDRELTRGARTAAEIDAALSLLADASLLAFGVDGATVIMHRFVQRVARDRARTSGTLATAALDAARLLQGAIDSRQEGALWSVEEVEDFRQQVSSLWTAVADDVSREWEAAPELLRVRAVVVNLFVENEQGDEGLTLASAAYADSARVFGPEHPETRRARGNLAGAHSMTGARDRACALLAVNLRGQTTDLGARHPDTMRTRHTLANVHLMARRTRRATRMLEEVLSDRADVLGAEHPDTLTSRNALGLAYGVAGRHAEAILLLERTLEERKRVLGPDHSEIILTLTGLAEIHSWDGHADEVVALREEILLRRERRVGPDPEAIVARGLLADAYAAAGEPGKAIRTLEQNLALARERYAAHEQLIATVRQALDDMRRKVSADPRFRPGR